MICPHNPEALLHLQTSKRSSAVMPVDVLAGPHALPTMHALLPASIYVKHEGAEIPGFYTGFAVWHQFGVES